MYKALFLNPIHMVGDTVGLTEEEFLLSSKDIHETLTDPNLTHATISIIGHYKNGDVLFETDTIETLSNGERMLVGHGTVIPMGEAGLDLYMDTSQSILMEVMYSGEHDEPNTTVQINLPDTEILEFSTREKTDEL